MANEPFKVPVPDIAFQLRSDAMEMVGLFPQAITSPMARLLAKRAALADEVQEALATALEERDILVRMVASAEADRHLLLELVKDFPGAHYEITYNGWLNERDSVLRRVQREGEVQGDQ